jgi:ribonuclease HI
MYVYSDASFSQKHNIAVIGAAIFRTSHAHDSLAIENANLQIEQIDERNCIRAELRSAISALKSCVTGAHVKMFCDCQAIVELPSRKQRLESLDFMSQRTKQALANADLYRQFFAILRQIHLEILWVKGHAPSQAGNHIQKNFSYLDRRIRQTLRAKVNALK